MLNLEQQIFHQLERSKNILILFPASREGDAVASSLALFLFLKQMNRSAEMAAAPEAAPKRNLSFLPAFSQIQNGLNNLRRFIVSVNIKNAKVSQIKYTVENDQLNFIISPADGWFKPEDVSARAGEFKYDLIITLGTTDLESLGQIYDNNVEFFYKTNLINIDHHSANEEFGQVNFIDLSSVATSEILFYLLKNYRPELITEDVATCLLAGIIYETKNFKTSNLTPRTLLSTSELITLGARREEIVDHLYRSRNIGSLKLWGRLLNNLKSEKNDELLWSKLSIQDLEEAGTSDNGLSEIIDELIATVPGAKIVAILEELKEGKFKALIYSLRSINALEMIKEYSPVGTPKLAAAIVNGDLKTEETKIIASLKAKLDKIG